jgi:cyclophilin family peptidyl-prolyl cis-trans isomerase
MHQDYDLQPQYSVFGKAIEGLDVVDDIAAVKTGPMDRPVEDVTILGVDVTEA